MRRTVVAYEKELPEVPGRRAWEKPDRYLVRDLSAPLGWRVEESGRRRSDLLLVNRLRTAVDAWRAKDYPGVSEVARRLFQYWFEEDEVSGFRFWFCQREAIETLVYVVEILGNRDVKPLIHKFGEIYQKDLLSKSVEFQTTVDGQRKIRRYFPEIDAEGVQDLPIEDLRRYAFRMATGSGKTWVMAMVMVWSYFHKKFIKGSDLSTNFLVLAPNVIVYERLERDFGSNEIFNTLPLVPPEWRGAWLKVILRGQSTEPDASGNLFLTNIHHIYESRQREWTPQNAIQNLLGPKPSKDVTAYNRTMLDRLKDLKDLVVMNDEAHHVHDEDLAWSQSLLAVHSALPRGLSLWLDFSATPKDQNGMYYPWTLVDYPLAQAVEDRIVKSPVIVTKEDDPNFPRREPENVTKDNVVDKYGFWIHAAIERWKEHEKSFKRLGLRPVLFIVMEKNVLADEIGRYLHENRDFRLKEDEILIIHTNTKGEITEADLPELREKARKIDAPDSKIKVIVSVLMLREGWDVKNVSVVLGLRPFTARAEILPEQIIGRGLRLMPDVGPDRTQTLEVLGNKNLLDHVKDRLEAEGVGVAVTRGRPPEPVVIEAILERIAFDIAIPITKPLITHNIKKISSLDVTMLKPIYDNSNIDEPLRIRLKMEFATTQTEIHQVDLGTGFLPLAQEIVAAITNKTMQRAKLANVLVFKDLVPLVYAYLKRICFGREVELESDSVRSHLGSGLLQDEIAAELAKAIGELTIEKREIELEESALKLSETRPFHWTRNLQDGPMTCENTIFNFVATFNNYERDFAKFLDSAPDVLRFASLGTTEQGESSSKFHVTYLKRSGAIGRYYPDWIVVQKAKRREVYWIIETKGRVWEDTHRKDEAIRDWCQRISIHTGQTWRFERINQQDFEQMRPQTLSGLIEGLRPQADLLGETNKV